jgi:adenosylmethionine-8-amino-7-oxononanoate aminotransferase
LSDNGSTAVEAALKMALQFWRQQPQKFPQKQEFLALTSAFHGETWGATALGDVGAFQVPLADVSRAATHLTSPADDLGRALSELEQQLRTRADQIAALVIEPLLQGAGGMKMYDPSYLREARWLTAKHDVLLIVDEVFTGYGRTGRFWACDHAEISPDILCSAKGLSGGVLPFAATATTDRVFESFLGERSRAFMYGHTFCGNPLGAAVACEVLRIYQDEQVLEGIAERAQLISKSVERLSARPHVHKARSLGMCGAVNLGQGGDYLSDVGWRVYQQALSRGAYLRPLGNVVYVAPPLNIPLPDLQELLSIFESSVVEVLDEHPER